MPRRARDIARRSRLLRSAVVTWRHRGLTPDDVFVASFPRSGNTFLRFLLADMATGAAADFESVDALIPNVGFHRAAPPLVGRGRLIKTHEPYRRDYRRAVYLVRDVRDVLISWYRVMQWHPEDLAALDGFVRSFMTVRATPYGDWQQHVRSWREASNGDQAILFYRFEDLRADPATALREIAGFLGLAADDDQITTALARNTPQRMRELEEASVDYLTRSHGHRSRGVRAGVVGGWRELLGPEHMRVLAPALALNAQLGYDDE